MVRDRARSTRQRIRQTLAETKTTSALHLKDGSGFLSVLKRNPKWCNCFATNLGRRVSGFVCLHNPGTRAMMLRALLESIYEPGILSSALAGIASSLLP